jgi:carbon monoxide dehydrogenase subunit G
VTWFSARNISLSRVPVCPEAIWSLVTDPESLASLTPLVRSIESSGEHWLWTLNGIEGLGLKVEAAFTERMEFIDQRQIIFAHEPRDGAHERAAVEGIYDLVPNGAAITELKVDLTLSVDLPLPRLSRIAVERIMHTTMRATGQRFASNLYVRLGLDPDDVAITELAASAD